MPHKQVVYLTMQLARPRSLMLSCHINASKDWVLPLYVQPRLVVSKLITFVTLYSPCSSRSSSSNSAPPCYSAPSLYALLSAPKVFLLKPTCRHGPVGFSAPTLYTILSFIPFCSCLYDWALLLQPKEHSPKQQSPGQNGAKLSSRATSRTFSGLMADVPACLSFSDLSNSYPADFESEYGPNHPSRELVRTARRVVVKVCFFNTCYV